MQVKELKIGSLLGVFEEAPYGGTEMVQLISVAGMKFEYDKEDKVFFVYDYKTDEWVNIIDLKPIPLTGEWLVKFGFEWNEPEDDDYSLGFTLDIGDIYYLSITPTDRTFYNIFERADETTPAYLPNKKLEYVHQLQNLYLALIGKELEYKK